MRVGVRVRRKIGRFEMDYVLWLCHYHSTGVSVSGCFGLFLFFFFFSYLKVNAVCRMGVLPVLIVNTGVDDSWCRGVGESWWELSCTLFSAP